MALSESLTALAAMQVHTIAFVTDRLPSAAIKLALRFNANVRVLVLAPRTQRAQVQALGASWADLNAHDNRTRAWASIYRQAAPGTPVYWRFCHMRWLALASELRAQPPPANGAVAVVDDDLLLFEQVEQRRREVCRVHPAAHAQTVVGGAYVLAAPGVLTRFAAFLWALYALPDRALADIAWKFGERRPLSLLNNGQRSRIDQLFQHGNSYALFTDMHAIDAFRILSRTGQLPEELRVQWNAGYRRQNCTHAAKADKLHIPGRTLHPSGHQLQWHGEVPYPRDGGAPLCFLHLQGPTAKHMLPTIAEAGGLLPT